MSETGVGGYGEPDIGDEVAEGISHGAEKPANPELPDYAQPQEGSEAAEED
jgi:hypothetical protein